MGKLNTPINYVTARHRDVKLPGASNPSGVARATVAPANLANFFLSATEDGVSIYSTSLSGDEFRIIWQDGQNLVEVALSNTAWLEDSPFLHTDPAFGQPDVIYHLEARLSGHWERIGTGTIDLSSYSLNAPEIVIADSNYNSPFVHIEITWDGDLADLEHFQFEWQNVDVWEILVKQPDLVAHVELPTPPDTEITVRVRAHGLRLGNSAYSAQITFQDAGSSETDPNGTNENRSNYDHRAVTPNLVFNSSFEFVTGVDAQQWTTAPTVTDAWGDKDGLRYMANSTAEQVVSARTSNTDFHSFSCYAKRAGDSVTILDEDGGVISSFVTVIGINTDENFRVPSTHGSFTVRLTAAIDGGFDKIQVNQGPTVDPWAIHVQDAALSASQEVQDLATQSQTDFDTVFGILGGESGSAIIELDDQIALVVGHLDGTQTGSFSWIDLTNNSISSMTLDIIAVEGDVSLARTDIDQHSTRITNTESGVTTNAAGVASNTAAVITNADGLSAATTDISQLSSLVNDPTTGNTELRSVIDAQAITIANNSNGLLSAIAGLVAVSGQADGIQTDVDGVQSDVVMLDAQFTAAAGVHATIADRFISAEGSIDINSSAVVGLDGAIVDILSQVVVKAEASGGGNYSLALVNLTASAAGGSAITLAAENIDIIGTVTIMGQGQHAGTLDGQVLANQSVTGGALKITNVLGVGYPDALGFIGGNGTHWSRSSAGSSTKCIMQPSSPYFLAEGTTRTTVDNSGIQTWEGSNYSYMRPTEVRAQSAGNFSAITPTSLIIAGTQVALGVAVPQTLDVDIELSPGDDESDAEIESKTIIDGSTLRSASAPAGLKIHEGGIDLRDFDDGFGGFDPVGTATYCFRPPEFVPVTLTGLGVTSIGVEFVSPAITIADRGTGNYAAIPGPAVVVAGLNAGGDHMLAAVTITDKTATSFKVRVTVPPLASRSADPTITVTVI